MWGLKSVVSVDEDEFIDETLVTMALIPRKISVIFVNHSALHLLCYVYYGVVRRYDELYKLSAMNI